MKNRISKKIICLAAAAVVLVGSLSIGKTMAYFSTYVVSAGEKSLDLEFADTVVYEDVTDGKKIIAIQNNGPADCYVRVKVIVANANTGKINVTEPSGDNWTDAPDANGYYYYRPVLKAANDNTEDDLTTPLHVEISDIKKEPNAGAQAFNVIVIQENAPVLYKAGGETYADWDGSDFIIESK